MVKPLIKWAGGKTQLLHELEKNLPNYITNGQPYIYVEPFCGSAALALHLLDSEYPPSKVILNDINTDLMSLYQVVKQNPTQLLAKLKDIQQEYDALESKQDKQPYYYEKRDLFNKRELSKIKQASLFIFLNRAGFNGLYRVNKKNQFNVPIGSYKKPNFVFEDVISRISTLLQKVEILNSDYNGVLEAIGNQNTGTLPVFFYLDPPYRPLSDTSSFTSYAKDSFTDNNQIQLKQFCDTLNSSGYQWLQSNSDPNSDANTEDLFFDNLYSDYCIQRVEANRSINSKGSKRGNISELLIRNF